MTTLIHLDGDFLADDPPVSDAAPEAPDAAREDGTGPSAPLVALAGERMSAGEQVRAGFRTALRAMLYRWRDLNSREGGLWHAAYHGRPGSLASLDEYTRSRAWVQTGHDGGIAELTVVAWDRTIGWAGVALGNWISWTAQRWLRGTITFLIAYLLAAVLAYALGERAVAGGMVAGLAAFAVSAWLLLAFLAGRRHRQAPHRTAERED